ncbi:hypothetical protein [Sulfurimonas sp.]|uniref:hypothetical protein n=1 Tax=Sulfurimonas sp. TaxID=2022749 RepID=UPI00356825F5
MPAPTIVDQTVTTECGQLFKTISKHRNGLIGNISRWTIAISDEYNCFKNALAYTGKRVNQYDSLELCWGIHTSYGSLSKLGENNNSTNIKFAKFTKHSNNREWHGYPADYQYNPQDVPETSFLKKLKEENYLTKAKLNKIIQGKSCNL